MFDKANEALEPIYAISRKIDNKLNEQPSEVRIILSVISLVVNVLVPVVYLIAHKPRMAVWMTGFIILQFFMWGAWFFGPGLIGVIANGAVGVLSIIWIAFWIHALILFITKIIPEWNNLREQEAVEEENQIRNSGGVRIGYDDEEEKDLK